MSKRKEESVDNVQVNSDNEITDINDKDLSASIEEVQQSIFRNSNIYIENSFETISNVDKKSIRYGLMSKRSFKTVLDFDPLFRKGAIGLSFFSLFDKVLFSSLSNNATRIGAVLSNKIFLRKLIYDVMDSITVRAYKQNRGFIKKSFQVSRKEIADKIVELLNDNIDKTREPQRGEFIEGLAGVIEIGLVAQLVNYSLYDVDDLNEKILSNISDKMGTFIDYMTLQNNVIVNSSIKAMTRIFGSTSRLSDITLDDNKYKSVDHAVIVDNFLHEMDQIAEVLLMENVRKNDIDEIFFIARIYRDKEIFSKIDDMRSFVDEIVGYVETNTEGFDLLISNYDMNMMMDDISRRSLSNFCRDVSGKLHINIGRYNRTLRSIKDSLYDEKFELRIYTKEEYNDFFSLLHHSNNEGFIYHTFLRRNLYSTGERIMFDTLIQKFKPSRDLVKSVKDDESYIMLANGNRQSNNEFMRTIDNINRIFVETEETAYIQLVSDCMPEMIDGVLFQATMLKQGDLLKLAAINSDYVYVPFASYCSSLLHDYLKDFQFRVDLKVLTDENSSLNPNIIYVKQTTRNARHMDWFPSDFATASVTTREPRRVVECLNEFNGSKGLNIVSAMLNSSKYLIDKKYMQEFFSKDLLVWPKNRSVDISIELDDEYADIRNFVLNIDFDRIIDPINNYSIMIASRDIYNDFMDEYTRVLAIFRTQIIAALCSFDVDIDRLRFNFKNPDLSVVKGKIFDNENYLVNKKNVGYLCQGFFDTGSLLHTLTPELCAIENGAVISRHLPLVNSQWNLKSYKRREDTVDGSDLLECFKKTILFRHKLHYKYSYQYCNMQMIIQLYNQDLFFKSVVDSCLRYNSNLTEDHDTLYAFKLVEMYSKMISSENMNTLQIVSAVYVAIVLRMIMSKSGDLNILVEKDRLDEFNEFINDVDRLDTLIYSKTKLILSRRGIGITDNLPNGENRSLSILSFGSMFDHRQTESKSYENKILASVSSDNRNVIDEIEINKPKKK